MALLSPHFKLEEVTQEDLIVASLAWGFTLGFGWLTTCTALRQTAHAYRRRGGRAWCSVYIVMIWSEISVCLGFGIICFLYLLGRIQPSFIFYFCILTLWALQVQFLLQIIINRCAILLPDKRFARNLKIGVAVTITLINISVYNIWIPARLQISEEYIFINEWWDRCEKAIYLIIDAGLNLYFINIVQRNLVKNGLQKYRRLVQWNKFIIAFSLGMDVLIISMMSMKNTFVYMQFHPLAYIVKLEIEMSMADLIVKVARGQRNNNYNNGDPSDPSNPTNRVHQSTTASGARLGISTTAVASHLSNRRSGYKTMAGETPADQIEMAATGGNNGRNNGTEQQHRRKQQRRRSSSVSSSSSSTNAADHCQARGGGGGGGGRTPMRPEDGIFTTHEVHVEYEESSSSSTCPLSPKAIAETIEELEAAEQTPPRPRDYADPNGSAPSPAVPTAPAYGTGDGRIQAPPKASFRDMLGRRH